MIDYIITYISELSTSMKFFWCLVIALTIYEELRARRLKLPVKLFKREKTVNQNTSHELEDDLQDNMDTLAELQTDNRLLSDDDYLTIYKAMIYLNYHIPDPITLDKLSWYNQPNDKEDALRKWKTLNITSGDDPRMVEFFDSFDTVTVYEAEHYYKDDVNATANKRIGFGGHKRYQYVAEEYQKASSYLPFEMDDLANGKPGKRMSKDRFKRIYPLYIKDKRKADENKLMAAKQKAQLDAQKAFEEKLKKRTE